MYIAVVINHFGSGGTHGVDYCPRRAIDAAPNGVAEACVHQQGQADGTLNSVVADGGNIVVGGST